MKCLLALLVLFSGIAAPALAAQVRTPDQSEALYHEVGDQLFCICGCREKLLSCSHNVCASKTEERNFLRELTQQPQMDSVAIKSEMVKRFGPKVLQVPQESNLYPVLAVAGLALVTAFGGMFWYVAGRRRARQEEAPQATPEAASSAPANADAANDRLTERIERDVQELDP